MSEQVSPYDMAIIIALTNEISNLVKKDEDFLKLVGLDLQLRKTLVDKIGQTTWDWYCDIQNPDNFIAIDLKKSGCPIIETSNQVCYFCKILRECHRSTVVDKWVCYHCNKLAIKWYVIARETLAKKEKELKI